jgi:hypothetical protein
MSFLDGLLGAGASASILGSINTQHDDAMDASRSAQLQAQYSKAQQARFTSHQWVFNSRPCTLNEFADAIWGKAEHPDKMLFLLTHSGPRQP